MKDKNSSLKLSFQGEWLTLRQAVIVRCNKIQWGQSEYSWAVPGTWWLQVNRKVFVCRNGQWLHVFSSSRFLKVNAPFIFLLYTQGRWDAVGRLFLPSHDTKVPVGALVWHQSFQTGKTSQPFLQNTLFEFIWMKIYLKNPLFAISFFPHKLRRNVKC